MGIDDDYTAYCLDEACGYIVTKMIDGEEPKFKVEFKSIKDMYEHFHG